MSYCGRCNREMETCVCADVARDAAIEALQEEVRELRLEIVGRARALLGCSTETSLLSGVRRIKSELTDAERVVALLQDAARAALQGHGGVHEDWCLLGPDDKRCTCHVAKLKSALAEAEKISIMRPQTEDPDAP